MKFSLDASAKTAEVIGAVAVVLSLIYVGYQVQQNTQAIKSTVHMSLVDHVISTEGALLNNADLAEILVKGEADPDSLTPAEQYRAEAYYTFEFINWENAFLNYHKGFVDEKVWVAWDRSNYPDEESQAQFRFWQAHRQWFDDEFARHVDRVYADHGYIEQADNRS